MGTPTDAPEAAQILESERDRYRILAPLGEGGFGVTSKAQRDSDGQIVVVKQLRMERVAEWKAVELFTREARALEALNHPAIPAYVDFFESPEGTGFALVQAFVEGPTLQQLIEQGAVPSPRAMFNLFWGMLEVCEYLHSQNPPVIHRDITPKNIILQDDETGRAALIDFGTVQARIIEETGISSTAAGTYGYAPPEQFIGHATPVSDLFGLAMTFLAVALSTPPERMPTRNGRVDVQAALAQTQGIDGRLQLVLADMLHPQMERRPQSAAQVRARLSALRRDEAPLGSTPAGPKAATVQMDLSDSQALDRARLQERRADALTSQGEPQTPVLDATPQVRPWLQARARLELIGGGQGMQTPPDIPVMDIDTIVFAPSGTRALLRSSGAHWELNLQTMRTRHLLTTESWSASAAFSPDGARAVICVAEESKLILLDFGLDDTPPQRRDGHLPELESLDQPDEPRLAVSPDHNLAAITSKTFDEEADVLLVDLVHMTVLRRLRADCSAGIEFSADGRYFVCRGAQSTIFSIDGGEQHLDLRHVHFSPDAKYMAAVPQGSPGSLLISPLGDTHAPPLFQGELRPAWPAQDDAGNDADDAGTLSALRYSPDGRMLLVHWDTPSCGGPRESLLIIDAVSGAVLSQLGSPHDARRGLDAIHNFAMSANGRSVFIFGRSETTRWTREQHDQLMCWSLDSAQPRYLGRIALCFRLPDDGPGLYIKGQKLSDEALATMGIQTSPQAAHKPTETNFFTHSDAEFEQSDVVFGQTPSGWFGRLDSNESLGVCGLIEPWERPEMVRAHLLGQHEPLTDARQAALLEDYELRLQFFEGLLASGELRSSEDIAPGINDAQGLTHLLPEILRRAREAGEVRPRFGAHAAQPLSRAALASACAQLEAMTPEAREALFDDMLERQRATMRQEYEDALAAHRAEQARQAAELAARQAEQAQAAIAEIQAALDAETSPQRPCAPPSSTPLPAQYPAQTPQGRPPEHARRRPCIIIALVLLIGVAAVLAVVLIAGFLGMRSTAPDIEPARLSVPGAPDKTTPSRVPDSPDPRR